MSFHNEVHREAGWFDKPKGWVYCPYCFDDRNCDVCGGTGKFYKSNRSYDLRPTPGSCEICGTRTGLHGFSFDKR